MKINSILIANRGEIAIRIIRTAKKMGIKTWAVMTATEPNALYLSEADEVIDFSENTSEIPPFLDVERLVNAAVKHKIDAIHPGYGFLAESAYFAQSCENKDVIFIGPSSDAIYKMGNKTIARKIAIKNKISLLKGSTKPVTDAEIAMKEAEKIGYPVIIKAASGGGGKGMRIVRKPADMEKNFRLATSEAEKAFNDSTVFIEKYAENPRHIEFQILGDKHGNVIHLGERECSIQRKHQKLLEEAPSPALDEKLREKMGAEAIAIAKAVNYFSTGTVEFLLDDAGNYYFMEMNTRIQVEHPVTEMITGIDLVEQQIRIAQDEKLSLKQKDIKLEGWAMEFRINAEDVQAGFAPNTGIIKRMVIPGGKNVRVDTGFVEGAVIPPDYDSMIAKLIVYGEHRKKVITTGLRALGKIDIQGLKTTVPFFKAVLHNKAFVDGEFNTSFIETEMQSLFHQEKDEEMLAAFLSLMDYLKEVSDESELSADNSSPWLFNKRMKSI
jgi:acetyl-CoA carboxylase biotin carboxylase subunit